MLSAIPPQICLAWPKGEPRVYSSPIDTFGLELVRPMLAIGEQRGELIDITWGLAESDTPEPDGFREFISDEVLYCGWSAKQGMSYFCIPLGPRAGRKRWMRVELSVIGYSGWILAAVLLEFFAERPGWADAHDHVAGEFDATRGAP